MGFAINISHAQ